MLDCIQLCLFGWKSLILLDLSSMLRLYVQQGLSNRVLRALQERLERAMSGNPGEETRDRTRSPVRAVHGDGTGPDGTIPSEGGDTGTLPHGGADTGTLPHGGSDATAAPNDVAAPAAPGIEPPNASLPEMVPVGDYLQIMHVSNQLAQNIATCGNQIQSVGGDLEAAVEIFHRGSETIKKGLTAVADQIAKQTSAVTTMSGGLMYETTEISKLLKAFDRFSNATQWFMKAKQPLEANIHDLKMEVAALNSKMEATMGRGFEATGNLLKDLIKVNERIVTLMESQAGRPGGSIGETPPIRAGMVAPASVGGIPPFPLPTPPPVPANTGTTPAVAGNPPRATGAGTVGLPTSLFLAFCPETPGGQRPSAPSGEVTPCQRVGILTKDAGSNQQRTLSPTGYRPNEISHLTSLWAPNGLGTIRDGQQLVRRIY